MKTLLQINLTCEKGSSGKIAADINNYALKNGFDCYCAYGYFSSDLKNSFKIESSSQQFFRRLKNKLFGIKSKHSRPGTKSLIKKINEIKPDIIHFHNIHHQILDYEYLLKYISHTDIKTILTLHDCWAFTGGCYHYTAIKCSQWQNECLNCPTGVSLDNAKKDVLRDFSAKKNLFGSLKNFKVTAVSDWLKGEAERSYLSKFPILTIQNGIDTDAFKPRNYSDIEQRYGVQNKFVVLGIASVWNDGKRFDDFIRLSKELNNEFEIIIIGKLTEYQRSKLTDKFIHIENTNTDIELSEIYSLANVLINFSLEETFGLVVAEAQSCGTPVIVYNSTANPEIVGENCGYVIEAGNFKGVVEKIMLIKENGKEFYKDSCVKNICNNYTKEIMVKKYIELYNGCLEGDSYDK